ncbi:MAG: hypothetical protein R3E97_01695 [Candidatus Eisenbacteria bacterium]
MRIGLAMGLVVLAILAGITGCGGPEPAEPSPDPDAAPSDEFLPLALGNVWNYQGTLESPNGGREATGRDSVSDRRLVDGVEMWRVDTRWESYFEVRSSMWLGQRGDSTFLMVDDLGRERRAWPAFVRSDSVGTERTIVAVDTLHADGLREVTNCRVRITPPTDISTPFGVFEGITGYSYAYGTESWDPSGLYHHQSRHAFVLYIADGFGIVARGDSSYWSHSSWALRDAAWTYAEGSLVALSVQ